jgi:hypothetical protein
VAMIPAANADRMEKICSMGYCSRVQSPQGSRGTDSNLSLFKLKSVQSHFPADD